MKRGILIAVVLILFLVALILWVSYLLANSIIQDQAFWNTLTTTKDQVLLYRDWVLALSTLATLFGILFGIIGGAIVRTIHHYRHRQEQAILDQERADIKAERAEYHAYKENTDALIEELRADKKRLSLENESLRREHHYPPFVAS